MLLAIFFIIGTAIFRGSLNYIIINAILSIGSISGIYMSNSLLLIISCYGKVGYYPFFSVLSMLFYNTSYLFILFDLINKLIKKPLILSGIFLKDIKLKDFLV